MRIIVSIFMVCLSLNVKAQHTEEVISLSTSLSEVSGIVTVNDTTFIVHNDGGNEPLLHVMNSSGKLIHSCLISPATNQDWEDLTLDDAGNLYIGDIGNNLNTRKDLKIYKVNLNAVLSQGHVTPEIIAFTYKEQIAFPPEESALEFDCEALTYYGGKLHMFTKSRTKPWKGYSYHYELPAVAGSYEINRKDSIWIGNSGWMFDAVTGVASDREQLYLLTYNRIVILDLTTQQRRSEINFKGYNQHEGIAVGSDRNVYVVAEKQRFIGGPFFKIISDDKK